MIIQKEIIINKNVHDAWNLLGPRFGDIYLWASTINHTEIKGEGKNGAPCSERGCDTTLGGIKEKLLEYSANEHLVKFDIYQGLPPMAKNALNTWQVTVVSKEKSKFTIKSDVALKGIMGLIMQPMMKLMMGKMVKEMTEDFKFFVENGEPSKAKLKAMRKYKG